MELEQPPAAEDEDDLLGAAQHQRRADEEQAKQPDVEQSSSSPAPSLAPLDTSAAPSSSVDSSAPSTASSSPASSPSTSLRSSSPTTLSGRLLEILTFLQQHPDAEPFLVPVSPEEAPGYYDTIKQPMDFSSIQAAGGGG